MTFRAIALIGSALLLVGCGTTKPIGSIAGGECGLVHTPEYSVRGRTAYDQRWISGTTESLVRGCNQPRPKARPASFDAAPKAVAKPSKAKPKKRRWWQRKATS